MEIIKKFKSFIHYYDPANFQLIYSLKAATTIAFNCFFVLSLLSSKWRHYGRKYHDGYIFYQRA